MASNATVRAFVDSLSVKNLDGLMQAVRLKESTDNYQADNGLGYVGAYQIGRLTLVQNGYVVGGSGTAGDPSSWVWTGKNSISNLDQFMGTNGENVGVAELIQDMIFLETIQEIWSRVRGTDKEFWGDQTLNDYELSVSGMILAAHLVGFHDFMGFDNNNPNNDSFILSGGLSEPADGSGVLGTVYLDLFGEFDLSDFSGIREDLRDILEEGFDGFPSFQTYFVTNPHLSYEIEGGEGDDILNGFGGNDTVIGSYGNDVLDGGENADDSVDIDTLTYENLSPVRVSLHTAAAGDTAAIFRVTDVSDPTLWEDRFTNFENLILTRLDDAVEFDPALFDLNIDYNGGEIDAGESLEKGDLLDGSGLETGITVALQGADDGAGGFEPGSITLDDGGGTGTAAAASGTAQTLAITNFDNVIGREVFTGVLPQVLDRRAA